MAGRFQNLSRRHFAKVGSALAGTWLAGCGRARDPSNPDSDSNIASSGGSDGGPSPSGGTGSPGGASSGGGISFGGAGGAGTCGEYTATNIEGPFFKADSPERSDIREAFPGKRLELSGKVFDENCRPIKGALIDFWQANEDGEYDNLGTDFRGHQFTDESGGYALSTIVPGRYLNGSEFRPAHVHVKVSTGENTLTTQLYFPDDPFNDSDSFIDFSLIIDVTSESDDESVATFDFVVNPGVTRKR